MSQTMLDEIRSQHRALLSALDGVEACRSQLRAVIDGRRPVAVAFVGMGSSFLVGSMAVALWRRVGWSAQAFPASEPLMHPDLYPLTSRTLVIGISRSGTTPETLEVLRAAAARGAPTVSLSVTAGTPLGAAADVAVVAPGGAETNPAQTRSVVAHLAAAQAIAVLDGNGGATPEQLRRAAPALERWTAAADAAARLRATGFRRLYVLGSGDRWAAAAEGAMKLKECARMESEAFQTLDFRHGPLTMVDDATLVIGLISASVQAREVDVLREAAAAGAQVLAIGEDLPRDAGALGGARGRADDSVGERRVPALSFRSGLSEPFQTAFYLAPLQFLAWYRAKAGGIDPSRLRHLRDLH